ncbi:MAG: hypothetical protein LLG00_16660 [Planctomycetaceae bacterium]|nr:hypothetical protein [Planctomycetaceae bacterium]
MSFDVGKKLDRDRLHKAIRTSRDAINVFRKPRTEMIRDYVGSWYSPNGARFPTYVNKLNQTAGIYTMALAFNNPQCKVTTFNPQLWPFARKFEVNINKVVANIDLKTTLQEAVLDAFFLMGVCKVRMADAGYVQTEDNVWIDPGKPWVDRVSFDDVILDLSAKNIRSMRFAGDRYRVSFRKLRERDDFDPKVVRQMAPTSKFNVDSGSDYASQIQSGWAVDDDELEPMVWIEDVYLPELRQVVTFAADNDTLPPLRVLDWTGHPQGPYKFLSLGLVPDNIIPSSPSQNLKGLHDLANRLYRKLSAQASRQKNVVGYAPGGEDDGARGKDAKDGEFFKLRDPNSLKPISFPGVDGATHAFFLAAQEVYNTQSGNERVIGGLGTEADTLGQEQIVQGHAGARVGAMKGQVNKFAAEICREIGGLMFDDEALTVDSTMEVENTGYFVDSSWRPGERDGLKDHYDFLVEPNSMGYLPPEAKLQKVVAFIQTVGTVLPLVQAGLLDLQEFAKLGAEYQNTPELQRIFKFISPESMAGGGDPHQATKPPVTSREVVRNNVSRGPSSQGTSAVLGQMMQSMGRQPSGVTVGG